MIHDTTPFATPHYACLHRRYAIISMPLLALLRHCYRYSYTTLMPPRHAYDTATLMAVAVL